MNVYAAETGPYPPFGTSRLSPPAPNPSGKTLVEGYRKDILTGFEKEHPRYNPLNPGRPQSSVLVDLKDPIQVHLLTETALSDSKHYEILSQEEVDDLKRQVQSLTQRVESTRANLTIQAKYRDAAINMARLYSPGKLEGKRRSLLGRHSGDLQMAKEAEVERQSSERKCEELASELFNLEKRLMEPQRRLLEHTAGILQLTHKASKKKSPPAPGQLINGMPGSPESLYTYSRNSMERVADDSYFDDTPIYQFDQLDGYQTRSQPRKNAIEIPMKSPIREQTNQLREEVDRVRDENAQLRNKGEGLANSIADMEQRLESLNCSLRDAIVRFDPDKNSGYHDPPYQVPHVEPIDMLRNQMDYLETGLFAIQAEQESMASGKVVEQRVEALNRQVRHILRTVRPDYPAAPKVPQDDMQAQFAYIEKSLQIVDSELERAVDATNAATNANSSRKQDNDQTEAVLMGLWDIIQTGFARIKQEKEERRKARLERGFEDEEAMSDDDEFDTDEPYTLSGFSARVQWLYRQATTLKDQKSVLKRQIKQQRELNNKSDAEKDEEIQRKQEELEKSQVMINRAEKEAMDAQKMLADALEDLEEARDAAMAAAATQAQLRQRDAEIADLEIGIKELQANLAAARAAEAQLEERNARVASLEADIMEMQEDLATASKAESQLQERNAKVAALEADIKEMREDLTVATAAQSQLDERNAKVAALETDVKHLRENLAIATAAQVELEERNAKLVSLEAHIKQLQEDLSAASKSKAQLEDRDRTISALEGEVKHLKESLKAAESSQKELSARSVEAEDRNGKIAALETEVKQLQATLASAEASNKDSQGKLAGVDSIIAALNMQLDETDKSKAKAEEAATNLQKQVKAQQEQLDEKTKALKVKEDELELLNMNMVEMKTELTIAQAELDGAYGSRAERAAEVAAIKNSGEVVKLQNQVTKLKNELTGTVKELEDVTKETLAAEREKVELETKLDEATSTKATLEGEVASLRTRLEKDVNKARERIAKLQEELDNERLKASPAASGRPGTGASMLSEQFRSTMREERKRFQEQIREEQARNRKLEDELSRLRRAQGPGKSPLSPSPLSPSPLSPR